MSSNPFDWLNAINTTKKDLIREADMPSEAIKQYPAFMVNRGLSYFVDTALYANEMNMRAHATPTMQNDYYLNTIPRRKRYGKWAKPVVSEDLTIIQEYFGYNRKRAEEALEILDANEIEQMKATLSKGGKS